MCGISWPPEFDHCPKCGDGVWQQHHTDPDPDWQDELEEVEIEEPGFDGPYPHPPDGRCDVHEVRGHLFLKHAALIAHGYRWLEDGSIVYLNDTFYELEGYSQSTGYWLVSIVETEGAADDLHPSMFEYVGGAGGPEEA